VVDGSYALAFQRLVDEQVRRNHEVIETMCERMLVTPGNRGVLVTDLGDGTVRAELSDDVPFGQIHYDQTRSWSL
jgi:hypothetical protein